ncbi:hypothetical protein SAMN05444422_11716 [Halobiforma haloterrestris]|uniref:Uncharacterized protein n=1 Tax=Natronobacterium haloterrestre TaxID=148448 RepID=A0A1I1LHK7_NATHA|nr:hypothetical protein [Halobiforma haloterrestris]SFC72491.1 hypothetical protein SAMN05444422_11716 [Halobiforma haloterrestris]
MIFLANRANLDKRTLLGRLHNLLQTQTDSADSPIKQVWYQTSAGNKTGVRATIAAPAFLDRSYAVDEAELQISFDFPPNHSYDFYEIQWVEPDRQLMLGWHQDETHMELGECHFQIDYRNETVQRSKARFLDSHPLNVFDRRMDHLLTILDSLEWDDEVPSVPETEVR